MTTEKEIRIESGWRTALSSEFQKPYFQELRKFIKEEYKVNTIFPRANLIFNAFDLCPWEKTKLVILGQDPYHGDGQAHGLAFSVLDGVPIPPSLLNIYKELKTDLNIQIPKSGNLTRWAEQGVLLLNATLTVRKNQAGSHQNFGWETFTNAAIQRLAEEKKDLVFLLWGSFAAKKEELIPKDKHLILKSPHPSPLSAHRGFFGCRHFSKANTYLMQKGISPIEW